MKKNIISSILVLTLCLTLTLPAFAAQTETDNIYIDASTMNQTELDAIIADAAKDQKVIVIDWQDGTVATLSPDVDDGIEPCLGINVTDTYSLNTTDWTYVGNCVTLTISNLKVTNKSKNPGSIDVKIVTTYVINNKHYYYDIPVGYTSEIEVVAMEYDTYLRASSVKGDYKVKVSDWII